MAITTAQTASTGYAISSPGNACTIIFGSEATAGNLLVLVVSFNYAAQTVPASSPISPEFTGTGTPALTEATWHGNNNPSGNKQALGIWYLPGTDNNGGGDSITFNQPSPYPQGAVAVWAYEFTGITSDSPLAAVAGQAATSQTTAWNTADITAASGELLVAAVAGPNGGASSFNMTTTPGSPWTNLDGLYYYVAGSINEDGITGWTATASGATSYDAVMPSNQYYAGVICAFTAAITVQAGQADCVGGVSRPAVAHTAGPSGPAAAGSASAPAGHPAASPAPATASSTATAPAPAHAATATGTTPAGAAAASAPAAGPASRSGATAAAASAPAPAAAVSTAGKGYAGPAQADPAAARPAVAVAPAPSQATGDEAAPAPSTPAGQTTLPATPVAAADAQAATAQAVTMPAAGQAEAAGVAAPATITATTAGHPPGPTADAAAPAAAGHPGAAPVAGHPAGTGTTPAAAVSGNTVVHPPAAACAAAAYPGIGRGTIYVGYSRGTARAQPLPGATQVAAYAPDGTQATYLGSLGHVRQLKYSFTWPGGCDKLTCLLQVPADRRPAALSPGWKIAAYRGGHRVWDGRLDEPQPGPDGWTITAAGTAQRAQDFTAIYTGTWPAGQPDDLVNQAITRGLDWVNPGVGQPSWAWYGQAPDTGMQTVKSVLDQICSRGGGGWYINSQPGGRPGPDLTLTALPTAVTRLLVCTSPVGRTLGADINRLVIRYCSAADNTDTGTAAVYSVTTVTSAAGVAAHQATEASLDLSNAGVMTAAAAQSAGNTLLAQYARATFAGPFTAAPGQLLTTGGQPVDPGCEQAGAVIRLVLLDYGYGGEVTPAVPVDFITAGYEWDDQHQVATITPYQSIAQNLQSLVSITQDKLRPPASQ